MPGKLKKRYRVFVNNEVVTETSQQSVADAAAEKYYNNAKRIKVEVVGTSANGGRYYKLWQKWEDE